MHYIRKYETQILNNIQESHTKFGIFGYKLFAGNTAINNAEFVFLY